MAGIDYVAFIGENVFDVVDSAFQSFIEIYSCNRRKFEIPALVILLFFGLSRSVPEPWRQHQYML